MAGTEYNELTWMGFSSDRKSVSYLAKSGKELSLLRKGDWSGHVIDPVMPYSMFVSPDLKGLAGLNEVCKATIRKYWHPADEWDVTKNDEKSAHQYDNLTFSPDYTRFSYRHRNNKKWQIVTDGVPGPEYDMVTFPNFSPDGKHLAYLAKTGSNWYVVIDGQPKPAGEWDDATCLRFSSDGKRIAYAAKKHQKWFVVVDGQPGQGHLGVGSTQFQFSTSWRSMLISGGIGALKPYCFLQPPVFSPDGTVEFIAIRLSGFFDKYMFLKVKQTAVQ